MKTKFLHLVTLYTLTLGGYSHTKRGFSKWIGISFVPLISIDLGNSLSF